MPRKRKSRIDKIVSYRQEHPYDTLEQIGERFEVSRMYIHKVLTKTSTPTTRIKRVNIKYCLECKEPSTREVHTGKCHFKYYNIKVTCAFCRIPFYRKRAKIIQTYNRGYKKLYCTRQCYYRGQREGLS